MIEMGAKSAKKNRPQSATGAANGNGTNGTARKTLEPMWKGPIHFVMRSAEATMPMRAEQHVEVEKIELSKSSPSTT